jgi:hypothetical protein
MYATTVFVTSVARVAVMVNYLPGVPVFSLLPANEYLVAIMDGIRRVGLYSDKK